MNGGMNGGAPVLKVTQGHSRSRHKLVYSLSKKKKNSFTDTQKDQKSEWFTERPFEYPAAYTSSPQEGADFGNPPVGNSLRNSHLFPVK